MTIRLDAISGPSNAPHGLRKLPLQLSSSAVRAANVTGAVLNVKGGCAAKTIPTNNQQRRK
jgi:hypothetical protein